MTCLTQYCLRRHRDLSALARKFHGEFANIKGRRLPPMRTTLIKAATRSCAEHYRGKQRQIGRAVNTSDERRERIVQLMIGRVHGSAPR